MRYSVRLLSLLLLLSGVGRAVGRVGREELPKISIGGWRERDFHSEWNYNSTPPLNTSPYKYSIAVPSTVLGMSLICNASYPVEWRMHQDRWEWHTIIQYAVQTTRFSNGLDVTGFSSELSFFSTEKNTLTGNYTCQKVGFPQLSSSMFVFWEGTSPPYLTLAMQYRKVPEIPFKLESKSFTLPCTVSVPSVEPTLTKEGTSRNGTAVETPIPQNTSVTYDPRYGFTLTGLKDPFGRYTCQVGDAVEDGDGDIITFNVVDKDDTPKSEFNETMRHGAYYTINSAAMEVICCSAGDKPPKLKLLECEHPSICAVMKHNLHNMESIKKKNGSCSSVKFHNRRAGVFRCDGAGIDVVREYFFPMPELNMRRWGWGGHGKGKGRGKHSGDDKVNQTMSQNKTSTTEPPESPPAEPYFDWYEADKPKMMEVTELETPLYVGETVKFTCKVSHFYYAHGIVWAILYTNQSMEYVDGEMEVVKSGGREPHHLRRNRHFQIMLGKYQSFIEIPIDQNLKSIICYAPVWNSTEWGKKEIAMEIKQPTMPTIIGRTREDQTWFLNDTEKFISCKFDGQPMPEITWLKNNKTITYTKNIVNETGMSKIVFRRVNINTQGSFECVATNVAGSVSKKFRVTVIHSASSVLMVVSTLSVIGLIFIAVATVFLCRYLKSQKSVIQHLANLAFKDVGSNGNGPQQNDRAAGVAMSGGMSAAYSNGSTLPQLQVSQYPHAHTDEESRRTDRISSGQHESFMDPASSGSPLSADPGGYRKL